MMCIRSAVLCSTHKEDWSFVSRARINERDGVGVYKPEYRVLPPCTHWALKIGVGTQSTFCADQPHHQSIPPCPASLPACLFVMSRDQQQDETVHTFVSVSILWSTTARVQELLYYYYRPRSNALRICPPPCQPVTWPAGGLLSPRLRK